MNKINLPPRDAFGRMTKLSVLLLLPLAAMNAAAVNFPVGTHLIKGTLKDWQNKVLTSSADEEDVGMTTIYVVPAEGAKSQFFKVEAK